MKHKTTQGHIRFLIITPIVQSREISHTAHIHELYQRLSNTYPYIQTTQYSWGYPGQPADKSMTSYVIRFMSLIRQCGELFVHISNSNYEYIHVHGGRAFFLLYAAVLSKIFSKKIICSLHSHTYPSTSWWTTTQSYLQPYIIQWVLPLFDLVITLDTSSYEYVRQILKNTNSLYLLNLDLKTIKGTIKDTVKNNRFYYWKDLIERYYLLIKHHSLFTGTFSKPLSYRPI